MKFTRYCRSMLSTPATAVDRYPSSHRSGADISMVDLEDSVAPWDKAEARARAEAFFTVPSARVARCAIRINAVTQPDGLRDLLAIQEYAVKPAIVVVPMVDSPRDIEIVAGQLDRTCPDVELFAVVETPCGLENAVAVARSSRRLRALVFGSADYSFAAGVRLSWDALIHARARVVNGARAAGVEVMDSPMFQYGDLGELRREAALAGDLGFSGKIAVHPRQVPVINEAFSPDAPTMERARKIVAAARQNGHSIAVVDGQMVGIPFFEASERLIEEFGSDTAALTTSVRSDA